MQYVAEVKKPDAQRLPGFHEAQLESLRYEMFSPAPLYPALEIARISGQLDQDLAEMGPNDPFLKIFLNGRSPKEVAETLVKGTKLADPDFRKKLVEGGEAAVAASDDPMIVLARKLDPLRREFNKWMEDNVQSVEQRAGEQTWKSAFRRIRQRHLPGRHVYAAPLLRPGERLPDERHAGAFEDHVLRPLRSRPELRFSGSVVPAVALQRGPGQTGPGDTAGFRDHQRHHRRQFRFPVVNRAGEIVGLVFDGNIESLVGDFVYEGETNRTVAVHTAAMTEVLKKLYNTPALVNELGIQ